MTAKPDELSDVASARPVGSMSTILTGTCGVDSAITEIDVAFDGTARSDVTEVPAAGEASFVDVAPGPLAGAPVEVALSRQKRSTYTVPDMLRISSVCEPAARFANCTLAPNSGA